MTLTVLKRGPRVGLIFAAVALLGGCFSDPNPQSRYVFAGDPASLRTITDPPRPTGAPSRDSFSRLRVGDLINVSFSDVPPNVAILPQRIDIPSGGEITLPYNVHVQAADKTTTELEKDIRDAYVPRLFVNLTVTVKPDQRAFIVDGEVKNPGRQQYIGEITVLRAIGTAGGFTDFANRKKIELRRQGGQKFFINYWKALDDDRLDLPVYPNDHIVVRRTMW